MQDANEVDVGRNITIHALWRAWMVAWHNLAWLFPSKWLVLELHLDASATVADHSASNEVAVAA